MSASLQLAQTRASAMRFQHANHVTAKPVSQKNCRSNCAINVVLRTQAVQLNHIAAQATSRLPPKGQRPTLQVKPAFARRSLHLRWHVEVVPPLRPPRDKPERRRNSSPYTSSPCSLASKASPAPDEQRRIRHCDVRQ